MVSDSINRNTLIRGLGLIAAISIILGNVIGTGVFLKARVMTCNVGSPTWVIFAWVAAGVLSLAGALTYAELSAMKPEAGGEYVFLRDAYGRLWSFLYGWMLIFVGKTGAQASVAVAFAIFLNDFLGGTLKRTLLETNIFGYQYELTSLQVIAVMMIVIITTINCASVSVAGQLATYFTIIKIGLILLVGFGAFFLADGNFSHLSMVNSGGTCESVADSVKYGTAGYSFAAGFGAAMLGALWGYDGWNNLTLIAGEVKNPQRNIPIALIGGTILIVLLYVFVNFAYFYVLDPTQIASVSKDSSVAREVSIRFLGAGAIVLMTAGLMASSIGTLHTSILTGARVPYAMAQDGLMFQSLGRLSEGTRVPIGALIVQGLWACLLAISGSFDTLTDYVIFGSWIFYALVTASVFVFRKKFPDAERPYKAFGYPVVPILFLLVAGWLLVNTLITNPFQSFAGIFLIALGLPVYYFLTKGNRQPSSE
ncbi:MAG: amino acid permease [Pyrinomonadaceae bacterium]|jgi:APA family basic amino acid/polyamine antiporter|nr:amino acid permease [Acidobacteriota bacterium]